MSQGQYRRRTVTAALGDEHRRQHPAHFNARHRKPCCDLDTRVTDDHLIAHRNGKAGAELGNRRQPGQQHAIHRPHPNADALAVYLHPRLAQRGRPDVSQPAAQVHFPAYQLTPGKRLFDGRQMRVGFGTWRDELDQDIQYPTAGQGTRGCKSAITVANHLIERLKLPGSHTLEKILLDTAARQRTAMLAAPERHQHGPRPTRGRAERGKHRAQPDRFATCQPVPCLLHNLQVELFHRYNPAISFSLVMGRLRTRLPVA